jgi:hypothetical protein
VSLKDLRELERAEIEALRKAARRRDKRVGRHAKWARRWPRWTAWWEARAKEVKIAATVVGGAVAIVTGVPVLARNAGTIWRHTGGAMWALLRARDHEATVLPPATGAPSTAIDFQKTAARPAPPEKP